MTTPDLTISISYPNMEQSIQGYLESLRLGEVRQFKNLAMVPVVSDYEDGLFYITLRETLGAGSIEKNPLMAWFVSLGTTPYFTAKFLLTCTPVLMNCSRPNVRRS
jgi:hypothetical protein